jgi:hypothetical protein
MPKGAAVQGKKAQKRKRGDADESDPLPVTKRARSDVLTEVPERFVLLVVPYHFHINTS